MPEPFLGYKISSAGLCLCLRQPSDSMHTKVTGTAEGQSGLTRLHVLERKVDFNLGVGFLKEKPRVLVQLRTQNRWSPVLPGFAHRC